MGKHTLTCNESKGDGTLVLEKLLRWNFSWNLGFAGTVVLMKAMVPASFQLIGLMSVRWPWEFIWDSSLNTPFQKRNNVSSWKKIIHFYRVFHYKPSILGYHYFRKPPNLFPNKSAKKTGGLSLWSISTWKQKWQHQHFKVLGKDVLFHTKNDEKDFICPPDKQTCMLELIIHIESMELAWT